MKLISSLFLFTLEIAQTNATLVLDCSENNRGALTEAMEINLCECADKYEEDEKICNEYASETYDEQ